MTSPTTDQSPEQGSPRNGAQADFWFDPLCPGPG